jgi:hypothetical protein
VVNNDVDLCGDGVTELCPIPQGSFSRQGTHQVPTKYTSRISAAAYDIPDLEGNVQITLYNSSNLNQNLGCFQSAITNGKSTNLQSVRDLTIALAAVALVIAGVSSATSGNSGAAVAPGAGAGAAHAGITPGALEGGTAGAAKGGVAVAGNVAAPGFHPPSFGELFAAMQGIAVSGMYSLDYPSVYRSFAQNLGWSTGMITWKGMQTSIDNFRNETGGNLTLSSYLLLEDSTLVYQNQTNPQSSGNLIPAATSFTNSSSNSTDDENNIWYARQLIEHWKRQQQDDASTAPTPASNVEVVGGIQAYVENLTIPDTNTFMTLLIWYVILVAIILLAILSFKLFVEMKHVRHLAKHKKQSDFFPDFKKSYGLVLMTMLVRMVIIFYGIWVLYSLFQFKVGDAWGTRLLAGLTLGIFSLILLLFSARIVYLALRASKKKGGLEDLFEHEPWIRKYGVFYVQYKVRTWWFFIPILLATFGRNAFLALGDGNGLLQVVGQLVIEILLITAMAILMPFNTRWGNGINLAIQGVRVASLFLLLTFTKQVNISDVASTGVGFALIVIQALLTITLILLLLTSAVMGIYKAIRKQQQGSPKTNSDFEDNSEVPLQSEDDEDESRPDYKPLQLEYNQGSLMTMFSKNSQTSLPMLNEKDRALVSAVSDASPGASDNSDHHIDDDDKLTHRNLQDLEQVLKDSPSRISVISKNEHENVQAQRASVVGELQTPSPRFMRHGRRLSHQSAGSSGQESFTWEMDGIRKDSGAANYIAIDTSPSSGESPQIGSSGSSTRNGPSSATGNVESNSNSQSRPGFF